MRIGVLTSEKSALYAGYALDLIFSLKGLCATMDFQPLKAKARELDLIIHYDKEELPGPVMAFLKGGGVVLWVYFSEVGFDSRPRQLVYLYPAHGGERVPFIMPGQRAVLKEGQPLYLYDEQGPSPEAAITSEPVGEGLLIRVGYDLLQLVFSLTSCQREYYLERRGTKVASWFGTLGEDPALLQTPIVNVQSALFFYLVERLMMHGRIPLLTKTFHPSGKRFALGLSHDVEVKKKPLKTGSNTSVMLFSGPFIA